MREEIPHGYVPRLCENPRCGIPFFAQLRFVKKGGGRFCSTDCFNKARLGIRRKALVEKPCAYCGTTMLLPPSQARRQQYCCYDHSVKGRYRPAGPERFWPFVDKSGECWLWTGRLHEYGYGLIVWEGITTTAHRVAWVLTYGPISNDLVVCHNCPEGDEPRCVRPDHMFLGTPKDNMQDCSRKGRIRHGDRHYFREHPELLPRGERVGTAKLTEAQVIEIRKRKAAGERYVTLGRDYGVDAANIRAIVTRKTWKHIP